MSDSAHEQIAALWNEAVTRPNMRFEEAIPTLLRLGVTRYHVDFAAKRSTTYVGGKAYTVTLPFPDIKGEHDWDPQTFGQAGVEIEAGKISYIEYVTRCIDAGMTDYYIYFKASKGVFMGAKGDILTFDMPQSMGLSGGD
jgi:uncharacterized protein YbcV (DUF1398 family)